MKKKLLPVAFILMVTLAACGQSAERLNNEGNLAFESQDYEGALVAYQQAQAEDPGLAEPYFNAANVHYRQENYDQVQQEIQQALVRNRGDVSNLDQDSFYNLGNTFFQSEEFEAAIEAYKETLRLNPDDVEAKQNLELALRQLQQEQQEQQQQDQQQDQQEQQDQQNQQDEQQQDSQQDDQQGKQQQDGQQDEQQQDQQQGDQQQDEPQQIGQQDEQQQEDQGQNEPQQNGQPSDQLDQPQQEGQAGSQPQQVDGLTPEQARQLFEAATEGAESLEEHLQQIYVFPTGESEEDW